MLLGNARAALVVSCKRNVCGKATQRYFWTQDGTTLVLRMFFFFFGAFCLYKVLPYTHVHCYIHIHTRTHTHTHIYIYAYKYMLHEPQLGWPICAGSIFQSQGHCKKGNECTFAHSHEELESFLAAIFFYVQHMKHTKLYICSTGSNMWFRLFVPLAPFHSLANLKRDAKAMLACQPIFM